MDRARRLFWKAFWIYCFAAVLIVAFQPRRPRESLSPIGLQEAVRGQFFSKTNLPFQRRIRDVCLKTQTDAIPDKSVFRFSMRQIEGRAELWLSIDSHGHDSHHQGTTFLISPRDILPLGDQFYRFDKFTEDGVEIENITNRPFGRRRIASGSKIIWANAVDAHFSRQVVADQSGNRYEIYDEINILRIGGKPVTADIRVRPIYHSHIPKHLQTRQPQTVAVTVGQTLELAQAQKVYFVKNIVPSAETHEGHVVGWIELTAR